jgi:hypothetical protein
MLEPLAAIPRIKLVSLQRMHGLDQLAVAMKTFSIYEIEEAIDLESGPMTDTAAILSNLDLVITADTAMAHLAGAMAVPVWILLSQVPDWRWLTSGVISPWYPTAKLFRQKNHGDWTSVVSELKVQLKLEAEQRTIAASCQSPDIIAKSEIDEQVAVPPAQTVVTAPEHVIAISVNISPGELLDKITILQIKSERIEDVAKLRNVHFELAALERCRSQWMSQSEQLAALEAALKAVNLQLWDVEDQIRECERRQDFGPKFVSLARSVYIQNDRRSELKRSINLLLGSQLIEEKSYATY